MDSRVSNYEDTPRKGLRKGTHSCLNCRRRKVRCTFEASSLSCNDCLARNNQCNRQDQVIIHSRTQDGRRGIRRRVQHLQSAVEQLLHRQSRDASTCLSAEARRAEFQPLALPPSRELDTFSQSSIEIDNFSPSPSPSFHNAPLLQLLDRESQRQSANKTQDKQRESSRNHANTKTHEKRILNRLKAHAPDSHTMRSILTAGQQSASIWHAAFPTTISNGPEFEEERVARLSGFIYNDLHSDETHTVIKVALCLALQVQQLPLSASCLPSSMETLQQQYISSIETLLSTDESFAGTINGLECMLMLSEFYINAGNMRKAWLIVRRAISLAQLLSVYESANDRHQGIWSGLWQLDRGISLNLGLPYACPDSLLPNRTGFEAFLCRLGTIGGHIIDRNLDRSKKLTYSITIRIDEEIEDCRNMMAQSWWNSTPTAMDEIRTVCSAKMRFFAVRKLLHLPFMLISYTDPRYSASRTATLQSAKAMIEVFRILRDERRAVINMCEMADFQVFSAALTVAVDLLANGGGEEQNKEEQDHDWELVDVVASELRRLAGIVTCSVAAKGAQVLEEFSEAHRGGGAAVLFAAQIPYFGNIQIRVPAARSTVDDASHPSWISGDSSFFPYGDTRPWFDEDFEMFDMAIADGWQWCVEETVQL